MMNMRNTGEAKIGDTFYHENIPVDPMPGFKNATPMVRYSFIFCVFNDSFKLLKIIASVLDKIHKM